MLSIFKSALGSWTLIMFNPMLASIGAEISTARGPPRPECGYIIEKYLASREYLPPLCPIPQILLL